MARDSIPSSHRSRDEHRSNRDSRSRSRDRGHNRDRYRDQESQRRDRSRSRDRHDRDRERDRDRGRERDRLGNDSDDRRNGNSERRSRDDGSSRPRSHYDSAIPSAVSLDPQLPAVDDDPRFDSSRGLKVVKMKGGGRNTESFDPKSTLVRPDMRIVMGPNREVLGRDFRLKHDDVLVVPNFFCEPDDWSMYYLLVEEMRASQASGEKKGAEWISWHEGAHLISKNPEGSATYQEIQQRIAKYFDIPLTSVGTRFNWYRDSHDWKPFHHDSAAFNPQRARNQNITVGVSFGATRELAFLNANNGTKIYFPQTNGMLFSFGRDVNINWKHGINALPEDEQDGKGRISIVLWGNAQHVIDEEGSPPMLTDNTRGFGHSIHSSKDGGKEREREVCRDFQKGSCRYGDSCRHLHKDR